MALKHSEYALNLINQLTLEEKIALVAGHTFMYTNPIPRLNIPALRMSDGPHGLRVTTDGGENDVGVSNPATCFPTSATSVNSWNPSLLEEMGKAIAEEGSYYGIDILLGPGMNIKRNPLCGRNFEYYSEDPYLVGKMASSQVKGLQNNGMGVSLKHFAFNNAENYRFMSNSLVDLRAAREIYLKGYEYVVKEAKPHTIMCAYNKLNGTYCSENKFLLKDILRDEWGFDGIVMTDWGAVHDRVLGIEAGNDLEMPGDTPICRKWIYDAVNNKQLDIKYLDECVLNILDLINKHLNKERRKEVDFLAHHLLAKDIATESAVLLKNEGLLPLDKKEKLCIIGELFEKFRYQGSGSSMINPSMLSIPKDIFDNKSINYVYYKGYKENELKPSLELINEAVEGSSSFDKVVLFIGLTDYVETEAGDRENMSLPENQLTLIDALVKANKKIVIVLYGGSVIELPFFDQVGSILNMFLPGQNGGLATYELLFGEVNPSGKLGETWPLSYKDVPFNNEFSINKQEVYKESIFVGYRYYLTASKEVRFPFGYGLSYTKFTYKDLVVKQSKDDIDVTLKVKNIGEVDGKEIVQVYVSAPRSDIKKPIRELRGFIKVHLKKNEEKEVNIKIKKEDLRYWHIVENRYVLEEGDYIIQVGCNSKDILLEQNINIKGEKVPTYYSKTAQKAYEMQDLSLINNEIFEEMSGLKIPPLNKNKPITLESRFTDLRYTFIGRIIYHFVINYMKKDIKKAEKLPEGKERDNKIKAAQFVVKIIESSSLRSISMSSSMNLPYNKACAIRDFANAHIIKGFKNLFKKIEAHRLPIDK